MRTPKQHREEVKRIQREYHEAGKCAYCGRPTESGKWLCKIHRKYASARSAEIQKRRLSAGVCVVCGEPLAYNSKRYCMTHLDYYRLRRVNNNLPYSDDAKERNHQRYKKLKESGLCVRCGKHKPLQGQVTCTSCLKKLREQRKNRRNKL